MNIPNQTLVLETQREAVAKLLDPVSFKYRAMKVDGFHITTRLHKECDQDIERALTKADQIIALILGGLGEEDTVSNASPSGALHGANTEAEPSGPCPHCGSNLHGVS